MYNSGNSTLNNSEKWKCKLDDLKWSNILTKGHFDVSFKIKKDSHFWVEFFSFIGEKCIYGNALVSLDYAAIDLNFSPIFCSQSIPTGCSLRGVWFCLRVYYPKNPSNFTAPAIYSTQNFQVPLNEHPGYTIGM